MNEIKRIEVVHQDGTVGFCEVRVTKAPSCSLFVVEGEFQGQVFQGTDLFNALIALRERLEQSGARALCTGARKDVYPSGMSRSMGHGRKAYVLRPGLPTQLNDLVDIFDPAGPDQVGTIQEQAQFSQNWIGSLH